MKALLSLAAIVPAFVAGLDSASHHSTVTIEQTSTRTDTKIYYVTVTPDVVAGDSAARDASGCPLGASIILYSNATETPRETLRMTSTATSIITNIVIPPDVTTTIYKDVYSTSIPTISSESNEMTFQSPIPAITLTVKPVPATAAANGIHSSSSILDFGTAQTLGCYSEPNQFAEENADRYQTIEACQAACVYKAWPFMAITGGGTCYCVDSLNSSDKRVDDAKCNKPCYRNEQQTCGGIGYWQVFYLNPHEGFEITSSFVTPFATCSTRVITVYVTGTPNPSTPKYLNTTSMSYPTGWTPPGNSRTVSRNSPSVPTSTLSTATKSLISSISSRSAVTTSREPTASARASTLTTISFRGSVGRASPNHIFTLVARFLTLSIFARAQCLEGRFYPYPTPIIGPLQHTTSIPPAVRFVTVPSGAAMTDSAIMVNSTTTMSTTKLPLLVPLIPGIPSPSADATAPDRTSVNVSLASWWQSITESSPLMTGGSGTYTPWWTSVRNITEVQTVIVSGIDSSNPGAATTLILTSTVSNVINVTSVIASTSITVETKASTKMVSMTMTSPAFSGPMMSSSAASDVRMLDIARTQAAVILMNMLLGCVMFLYILYFM